MHLTQDDLQELTLIAKQAALLAGKIIAKEQGGEVKLNHKEAGENIASCVVTEIDLMAQDIIIKTLSPTFQKYDIGLLAEESSDDNTRLEKDYFWCIDPLDGTLAFSRNEDGYSTSIALVSRSGEPIIGVVFNNRSSEIKNAIKDAGAFKNDSKLTVNKQANYLTLLFDQSFLKLPNYKEEMNMLKTNALKLGLDEIRLHHLGGAVMNGISTIELAPAIYYKHPKKANGGGSLWDFAASSIIQSEANGHNSDYHQNPLDLNRSDSTFMNHKGVIYCSTQELLKLLD
jgi:3'-phosphoadenosine 5'-phosphosulfate (PAPS) 3'-phosphatase